MHIWYLLLPAILFAVFYIAMCSYLILHTILSISGRDFFKKYKVSNSLCGNVSKVSKGVPVLTFLYNECRMYDNLGTYLDNSTEYEKLLLDSNLSDSDEIEINLNLFSLNS